MLQCMSKTRRERRWRAKPFVPASGTDEDDWLRRRIIRRYRAPGEPCRPAAKVTFATERDAVACAAELNLCVSTALPQAAYHCPYASPRLPHYHLTSQQPNREARQ